MTDASSAKVSKRTWFSPIWLIPILAVAIGLWMTFSSDEGLGPTVQLTVTDAEGIEPGKTLVKVRNVTVGRVSDVRLADDLAHAIMTLEMQANTERMLTTDSQFWVVKPRIGRQGVSGLNTLISGAYIQLQPDLDGGEAQTEFTALESPPVTSQQTPGLRFTLVSENAGTVGVGDPVLYRGFTVGRIEKSTFSVERREIEYQVFVESPYDRLLTENTRFWLESAVSLKLGSNGVDVNLGNLESLLSGGVTFDVPEGQVAGEVIDPQHQFELFDNREQARQQGYARGIDYVLLLNESVRGLEVGAPVEYKGIRVGTVTAVPYRWQPEKNSKSLLLQVPVKIRFEPDRLHGLVADADMALWRERMQRLIDRGMSASVQSANLLTSSLFIELGFYPGASRTEPQLDASHFNDITLFPTVASDVARLEDKLTGLLDKLNAIPMAETFASLQQTLEQSDRSLASVETLAEQLKRWLAQPEAQQMPSELNQTLESLQQVLQQLSGADGQSQNLQQLLHRMNELLERATPFFDTLERQPNALIFDAAEEADPVPKAHEE